MFATPACVDIHISKAHKVGEIIRHIITMCTMNQKLNETFLREASNGTGTTAIDHPRQFKDPSLYELRLLDEDDDDEYYLPLYEIAPLERCKQIGEFGTDSVAFCKVKEFAKTLRKLSAQSKI